MRKWEASFISLVNMSLGLYLPGTKNDAKTFIVDKFPNRVFAEFHVADAFGVSTVSPNDTGLVVVIEIGGEGRIWKKNTEIRERFS